MRDAVTRIEKYVEKRTHKVHISWASVGPITYKTTQSRHIKEAEQRSGPKKEVKNSPPEEASSQSGPQEPRDDATVSTDNSGVGSAQNSDDENFEYIPMARTKLKVPKRGKVSSLHRGTWKKAHEAIVKVNRHHAPQAHENLDINMLVHKGATPFVWPVYESESTIEMRAISRLLHFHLARAWTCYRERCAGMRTDIHRIKWVTGHLEHHRTSQAYETWMERADEIASQKAQLRHGVNRFRNRMLAVALDTWRGDALSLHHQKEILGSAAKHFVMRKATPAWNSWREFSMIVTHQKQIVGGALVRMGRGKLTQAWDTWRCLEQELAQQQELLAHAVGEWGHIHLARGWNAWRESYDKARLQARYLAAVIVVQWPGLNLIAMASALRRLLQRWGRRKRGEETAALARFKKKVARHVKSKKGSSTRGSLGTGRVGAGGALAAGGRTGGERAANATTGGAGTPDQLGTVEAAGVTAGTPGEARTPPGGASGEAKGEAKSPVEALRQVCDGLAGVFPAAPSREGAPPAQKEPYAAEDENGRLVDYFPGEQTTRAPSHRKPLVDSQPAIMDEYKDQFEEGSLMILRPAALKERDEAAVLVASPPHVYQLRASSSYASMGHSMHRRAAANAALSAACHLP